MNKKIKSKQLRISKTLTGFTIVELLVVIVIIGILATITAVSYSGYQKTVAVTQLKSDLSSAGSAMLKTRSYGDSGYPADVNSISTVKASQNVVLSGGSTDGGTTYCIDAVNSKYPTEHYYIDQDSGAGGAQIGTCASRPKKWASVAVGYFHTCAVTDAGLVYCWGRNVNGQLGNNSTSNSNKPVAVDTTGVLSGKVIKSITVGDYDSCALTNDGLVACWGLNSSGQLGDGSTTQRLVPVLVTGALVGKVVRSISTGDNYNCAITTDGLAYCWGLNDDGQLGNSSTTSSSTPVAVTLNGLTIKTIATGAFSTCAITSNDLAYCWGRNNNGQLGNNSTTSSLAPVAVLGALSSKTVKTISIGEYHACAIASDNITYCWGWNFYGQLGDGTNNASSVPVTVVNSGALNNATILSLGSGKYGVCAISAANQAYCWGWGTSGQLGNNTIINSNVPVGVSTANLLSGKVINSIAAGDYHACVVASDKMIYCWGLNSYGQLGDGTNTQSSVPVKVLNS